MALCTSVLQVGEGWWRGRIWGSSQVIDYQTRGGVVVSWRGRVIGLKSGSGRKSDFHYVSVNVIYLSIFHVSWLPGAVVRVS